MNSALKQLCNKLTPLKKPKSFTNCIIIGLDTCHNQASASALLIQGTDCFRRNIIIDMEMKKDTSFREGLDKKELYDIMNNLLAHYKDIYK